MTSNLPGEPRDFFKPEFMNRIDDIIRFRSLTHDDLAKIVEIQLRHLQTRLAARRITVDVTEEAKRLLATTGYDPVYGARPLKRVIQRELGDRLAMAILEGRVAEGDAVVVDVEDADFVIRPAERDAILRFCAPLSSPLGR